MGKSAIYTIDPVMVLTQPEPGVIEVAAVKVWLTDRIIHYKGRRIEIDADIPPGGTVYYVTITDPDQRGDVDGEAELHAVCAKDHDLCGEIGHTYMGAIRVFPSGNSTNVGTGGWPNPPYHRVCRAGEV
jgi:hypothetical protein